MIQLSNFPFKTLKTSPKVSDNKSTSLLLQAGFIRQTMAGVYEFLPLGYQVLKNIENIIREEMDQAWYHEMLMSILTPRDVWEKTWRWDIEEYFKVPWAGDSEYRIAPTNEENVTPILSEFIQSYKDLPAKVYHIQKKFRNEKRAKSGLLRWREFGMKDAYSFHGDITDFENTYEEIKQVYVRIFDRLWIGEDTFIAAADGGAISDKNSHEFQTKLEIWEDTIFKCQDCGTCLNDELVNEKLWFECIDCHSKNFETFKASEVWNIFHLGDKYTKSFWTSFSDQDNKEINRVEMGCYGIGTSRLMWVIGEYCMSDSWIAWPESIAPADYYILIMWEENIDSALELTKKLEQDGKKVILDDRFGRKFGFWKKMWDFELFWVPNLIILSPKTLEKWWYELIKRGNREWEIVSL